MCPGRPDDARLSDLMLHQSVQPLVHLQPINAEFVRGTLALQSNSRIGPIGSRDIVPLHKDFTKVFFLEKNKS